MCRRDRATRLRHGRRHDENDRRRLDGSPQSTVALTEARQLAREVAARVKALDVEQIKVHGYCWGAAYAEGEQTPISNARQRLGEMAGVDLEVVVGLPTDELVRFTDDVDVLVCGSRDRGPVKRVMLGSTSDSLVRHARSPLIIVPTVAPPTGADAVDEQLASASA